MDNNEQAKDLALLNQKMDAVEMRGDLKYVAFKEFADLAVKMKVQEEKIKGLEKRLNDYISLRKYMTATNISSLSLLISAFALLAHPLSNLVSILSQAH